MSNQNVQRLTISANGASSSLPLQPLDGSSTVQISADDWTGLTVALEGSVSDNRFSPVRENNAAVSVTSNWMGIVEGNGHLRLNVSGYTSNPVYLEIMPK